MPEPQVQRKAPSTFSSIGMISNLRSIRQVSWADEVPDSDQILENISYIQELFKDEPNAEPSIIVDIGSFKLTPTPQLPLIQSVRRPKSSWSKTKQKLKKLALPNPIAIFKHNSSRQSKFTAPAILSQSVKKFKGFFKKEMNVLH